jgi:heme-degrading monooxygenase HmoA
VVVVVFRARIRDGADMEQLGALYARMFELVSAMPGFRGVKDYSSEDREFVTIVEFDTLEQVAAWRDHPEHRLAQERGRKEFLADYRIQVCVESYGYGMGGEARPND